MPDDPFATDAFGGDAASPRVPRWLAALLAVAIAVVGGAGYAAYVYLDLQGDVQRRVDGVRQPDEPLDPFNVLLVGSDSRTGLTPEEQHDLGAAAVSGERADSLVLAHIDPQADTVVMVQFPRDLYVPIVGAGENKINAALLGGREALVETIESLTDLDIHHYAEVNIAGFRDVVDALGGVDVCIPEPIPFDPQTGIEIPPDEVGMVHFDGERALRFVRSRAFLTGDFERIENQQKFLAAAIDKVTSAGTYLNPFRIRALLRAAGKNLVLDEGTSLRRLLDIAGRLQDFDPQRYEAYVVPNFGIGANEAGSVVLPDYESMDVLFRAVARNESPRDADGVPDVPPAEVALAVVNATAELGIATSLAAQIQNATTIDGRSVTVVEATDGTHVRSDTTVRYRAGQEDAAALVAAALPGARAVPGRVPGDADVAVIAGEDFTVRRVVRLTPLPLPEPGDLPPPCR